MLNDQESKRTVRIGLTDSGDYPTIDIVGVAEGNTLISIIAENAVEFGKMLAQFVAAHTSHTPSLREACVIERLETQLYTPPE